MEELKKQLTENAAELVKMFGEIHPVAGGVAALLIVAGLAYLGIKIKKKVFKDNVKNTAEKVQTGTGQDQKTSEAVNDKIDDFLDGDDNEEGESR